MKTTIGRRIAKVGSLVLSIKALITDERPIIDKRTWNDGNDNSVDINIPSFLSLELLLPFDGFSRRRGGNITMTEVGRIEYIALSKKMVKVMQTQDIFYDDPDEGLSVYTNLNDSGISYFQVSGKVGKEYIALHPDVFVEEDNNIRTEGIRITLANANVSIVVTYADFLIMLEIIKDVNITGLSQLLYMTLKDEIREVRSDRIERPEMKEMHSRLDNLIERSATKLEGF